MTAAAEHPTRPASYSIRLNTSAVIPGRREAASPEPMNTGRARFCAIRSDTAPAIGTVMKPSAVVTMRPHNVNVVAH